MRSHADDKGVLGIVIELFGWAFLVVGAVGFLQTCGCSAPARITIHPQVTADHDYVENTVLEALDFVCSIEDIDCDLFHRGLRIEVYQEHLGPAGDGGVFVGLYWHFLSTLYVTWPPGECHNALVHELYHRVSWLKGYGNGYFERNPSKGVDPHGEAFNKEARGGEAAWQLERQCL